MPSIAYLQKCLNQTEAQRRFAWAKFFESERNALTTDIIHYHTLERVVESEIPEHLINELREDMATLQKQIQCPICLDEIIPEDLAVSKCGHKYCKECLDTIKATPNPKCSICRRKL
jgi:hypothetical protein